MSKKTIKECDEQADVAIQTMVTAIIGGAVVPVHVNWALAASAMGAGVVAIGLIYDVKLTEEEGWKLVKQFFLSAGFFFVTLNVGSKIFAAIAESTGIGYVGGAMIDGAISGASAWAVGACAKEYFRRDFLGKSKPTKDELRKIFQDAFKRNRK